MLCANNPKNMPVDLNLLPEDFKLNKNLAGFLKTAKALGVILTVIFIFFCSGMAAFFIYSRVSLGNIQTETEKLKNQVKALEASEQQLILLKDRISKITSARLTPNAYKNVDGVSSLLENTSVISMSGANITPTKANLSLDIYSNDDLSEFLQNVRSSTFLKSADLSSFSYSVNGYSLNLDVDSASGTK